MDDTSCRPRVGYQSHCWRLERNVGEVPPSPLAWAQGHMTAGLVIMFGGQHLRLRAKFVDVCADHEGIRMAWDWRGAASMSHCPICANVFRKNTDLAGILGCVEIARRNPDELAERWRQSTS